MCMINSKIRFDQTGASHVVLANLCACYVGHGIWAYLGLQIGTGAASDFVGFRV